MAGYLLAVLVPLALKNGADWFVSGGLIVVAILSVLVFSWFNFRPKNKAKCFVGAVFLLRGAEYPYWPVAYCARAGERDGDYGG